jgi:hypothetical protein
MAYVENSDILRPLEKIDTSVIGSLLRGSIDMHVHFGPDPNLPKRYNALETATIARQMGLKGIVLKNISYPTAPLASLVSELVPDIAVLGSFCLEYECGGLNVHGVETAAKLGTKVIWLPVFTAANSRALVARLTGLDLKGDGISILGTNGKLVSEIIDILKIIKDYDMVLATGHVSAPEVLAVVDKSKQLGLSKIVVTHPMSPYVGKSLLKAEEREMLAHEGVIIEHTAYEISPTGGTTAPEHVAAAIKNEGAQNCIMSTDFGAIPHPTVAEGMRMFISAMLKCGLSKEDITHMVKTNPARLLGI